LRRARFPPTLTGSFGNSSPKSRRFCVFAFVHLTGGHVRREGRGGPEGGERIPCWLTSSRQIREMRSLTSKFWLYLLSDHNPYAIIPRGRGKRGKPQTHRQTKSPSSQTRAASTVDRSSPPFLICAVVAWEPPFRPNSPLSTVTSSANMECI